jgi:hypothetical protein
MSDGMQAQEWHIRKHILRHQPPDLVVAVFVGDVTGEDMAEMNAKNHQATNGLKSWFVLLDFERLGSFSSEAKQRIRESPLASGSAAFGASNQTRIVMSLLSKVYSMVNRGASPVFFASSEGEARAWINERRKALADADR